MKMNTEELRKSAEQEELCTKLADCYWIACALGLRHTAESISEAESMIDRELRTRVKEVSDARKTITDLLAQLTAARLALTELSEVKPISQEDM